MKVKSESEVTQLSLTLRNPMDSSLPGSSAHGILQARVLEWGAIAFSIYAASITLKAKPKQNLKNNSEALTSAKLVSLHSLPSTKSWAN